MVKIGVRNGGYRGPGRRFQHGFSDRAVVAHVIQSRLADGSSSPSQRSPNMKKNAKASAARKSPAKDLPAKKSVKGGFAPQPEPPKNLIASSSIQSSIVR